MQPKSKRRKSKNDASIPHWLTWSLSYKSHVTRSFVAQIEESCCIKTTTIQRFMYLKETKIKLHVKIMRTTCNKFFWETSCISTLTSGFHMSGKSQTFGEFAVSQPSQILPICRENGWTSQRRYEKCRSAQKSGTRRENRNAPDMSPNISDDLGCLRCRVLISRSKDETCSRFLCIWKYSRAIKLHVRLYYVSDWLKKRWNLTKLQGRVGTNLKKSWIQ